jgi:hypothetical protein
VADEKEWDLSDIVHGVKEIVYIYEENGKEGLQDSSHNVILKAQFDRIENWQENGFILVDSGGRSRGDYYEFNKYGLINASGQILFRPQFDEVLLYHDSTALVLKDSLYGFVDNKGKWLIKPKFKYATPFYKGTAIVQQKDKVYLINKQQESITTVPNDSIWGFKNGVSVVQKDKKFGFINYRGELIVPIIHRGFGDFNWYHGMIMKDDEKWYVVDTTGTIVIDQGFDEVEIENEKDEIFAAGMINGKPVKIKLKN